MEKEARNHRFSGHLNDQEGQALQRLCAAKRPDGKNCTSSVFRDCIAYAYWALIRKYNGMSTCEPEPLPEIESEESK